MKKEYTSPEIALEITEAKDIIMASGEPVFDTSVSSPDGWLDIWA